MIPSQRSLQLREVSGRYFSLTFQLTCAQYLRYKSVKVSVSCVLYLAVFTYIPTCIQVLLGNIELLHDEIVECSVNSSTHVVTSPTPPSPVYGTVTLQVCNEHLLCDHTYFDIK